MKVLLRQKALDDLKSLDRSTYEAFRKHIIKISGISPRRHLKHGHPYHVENVGQGRIAYQVDEREDAIYIVRCFATHKEYEKWLDELNR